MSEYEELELSEEDTTPWTWPRAFAVLAQCAAAVLMVAVMAWCNVERYA